jgi:hypothetical protein
MLPKGTELGALGYREIYLEYNGPQLFSAKNEEGRLFLVMHAPRDKAGDNWLWREVALVRLSAIETNKIDLASAFSARGKGGLFVVTFRSNEIRVRRVRPNDLPDKWFPQPGVFLIEEEDEEESSLPSTPPVRDRGIEDDNKKESPLPPVPPVPKSEITALLTPVWRDSPEGRSLLAAMRVPVHEAAQHSRRTVCDFIIQPYQLRTDVGAAALGGLLTKTQRLMDALGSAGIPPQSASGARALRGRMELKAVAPFPGSFGLRLESATGSVVPDQQVTAAFDTLFRLLTAGKDLLAVRSILAPLGHRAAVQYRAFAKALAEVTGDFVAEMGVPGAEAPVRTAIKGSEVQALAKLLDAEMPEVSRDENFVGRLMGASLRNKYFLLEGEDRAIRGRIADEALPAMENKKLTAMHRAKIRIVTEVNETTDEEFERYILLGIEALA